MDNRRIALALAFALVVSTGATYFFYTKMRAQRAAQQPTTLKIVASVGALQAGTALTNENLTLIDWPSNLPLTGSFGKPDDVVGRSLIYPLSPKQPVLERDLAVAGSGIGLTVKIPEGMRATAVRSNDIIGVAGFLYPGSHVDVLLTWRPLDTTVPLTQTIMENVEVLTAGQRIEPDPQGKPETVNVVTLLLSPEDSEKIILANQQGTIQFILRNGADKILKQAKPVLMTELMGKKPPEPTKPVRPREVTASKRADFYTVETIAGEKRSVEKFQ